MPEPTSWLTVEPGWEVRDASGARVGEVAAVVGDPDADIFDGLRLASERGERFVRADRVGSIVEGCVSLRATLEELPATPADEEPGGAEIRPEAPGER